MAEQSQFDTPKPSDSLFPFPPHRRRHLKSETFCTFVRILSHLNGCESQHSRENEVVSVQSKQGMDKNELGQGLEPQVHHGTVGLTGVESEMGLTQREAQSVKEAVVDQSFDGDRMEVDEFEHVDGLKEELLGKGRTCKSTLEENNPCGNFDSLIGDQPGECNLVENPMEESRKEMQREDQSVKEAVVDQSFDGDRTEVDEFEHVGGLIEEHLGKAFTCRSTLEDNNPCGNFVSLIGDQPGECNLVENPMEELGKEMQEGKEHPNCNVFDSLDLCLDIDIDDEFRKLDDNDAEGSSYVERHVLEEVGLEGPLVELGKSVSSSGAMNSPHCLAAGEEIEEGEFSADVGVNDQSTDLLAEDALSLEKKVDEEQTSQAIANGEQFMAQKGANQEDTKSNKKFVEPIVDKCEGVQLTPRKSSMSAMACDAEMVDGRIVDANVAHGYNSGLESRSYQKQDTGISDRLNRPAVLCYDDLYPVVPGEISAEIATTKQDILSTKKKDTAVREKRKRGPLTEEKKEKKKKKKRIKRAETNRRLGVKRLKIQPIVKPKTVTYCRHYLRGRCQEGEKCKFSHDTTPLTKSTPCSHFARHSCMKGNDCPFDHELSKYPCNNFSSKGYCSRGTECMFSHEVKPLDVQPVEGSTNMITQLKSPSLPSSTNPENAELKSPTLLRSTNPEKQSNANVSFHQNDDYKSTSTLKKPPRKRAEQNATESVLKQAVQTPKGISKLMFAASNQAGLSPKADAAAKLGLPLKANTPGITQNPSENTSTGILEPKGINFLSFGKAPLHDSSSKDIGVKKSTVGDSSTERQSVLFSQKDDGLKGGNQSQGARTLSAGPRGINFLSFGKSPSDFSSNKRLASIPPVGNNSGVVSSDQEGGSASDGRKNVGLSSVQESASKIQIPGVEQWRVPYSPTPDQERENGSKIEIPGAKPWKMLSSSLSSAIFPGQTAVEHGKDVPSSSLKALFSSTPGSAQKANVSNMPNSTQKSLESILAHAAKYESRIKMDTPGSAESSLASSSSQSTSRGSTILDFLKSGDSKTKVVKS